ncbi:arylsulfatase B-like [Gigantopelta aegis]|uniref:arylsulfatase B-like n=1 Tax=Gigantopelta aegis TaxID=1735272 RepID=UPI001B889336|nr:arylsulfatase B-like [Gigantopelta aegis]
MASFNVLLLTLILASLVGAAPPHIVLIVADDLGWNDVSFHGSMQIPTPNIDQLAYSGIILNNYYVSPICTPTRSALLTGRHPIHTGMQHSVIAGDQPYGLPLTETIMPQFFQQLGYRRHAVGKWHLGFFAVEYLPTFRGFESHFGYWLGCEDYFDHTSECNLDQWGLDFHRDVHQLDNYTGLYSTELFTAEAVSIVQKHNQSEPLFLYLPYQAVHSGNLDAFPLQAPSKYVDRFPHIENKKRRVYAAMVSALDDGVGQVVQALRERGMLENSIIVFTTDNGGPANGFDGNAASNYPLRGLKATLWEGGVRGVGFINSPLLQKTGYISEQMMHVTDWLPTLFHAAGGNSSKLKHLDGVDSWEMLSTNGNAVRSEMLHNIDPIRKQGGLRVGDYKLLTGEVGVSWDGWYPPWQLTHDDVFMHVDNFTQFQDPKRIHHRDAAEKHGQDVALKYRRSESLGYVRVNCGPRPANASTNCQPKQSPCLFHIPSDPCEYNNIADDHQDIVIKLLTRLQEYSYTMVPPGNKPFDQNGNPKLHDGAWVPWIP